MELSTGRLEASSRIQEHAFGSSAEERRQRAPRGRKQDPPADDDVLTQEEAESHQLDDLA